jgi:hypothetical protein
MTSAARKSLARPPDMRGCGSVVLLLHNLHNRLDLIEETLDTALLNEIIA